MTHVLNEVLPVYRHRERHVAEVAAAPEIVWGALHALSNADLRLTRVLASIRTLPDRLPGGSLRRARLPVHRALVETFLERGFRELHVDRPWAYVAGAATQSWQLRGGAIADVVDLDGFRNFTQPGFILVAMSFELEATRDGTRLSTETRVQPTDAAAARAFRPYWWAIRGPSGLIRRDMLRAVRRHAEGTAGREMNGTASVKHEWSDR